MKTYYDVQQLLKRYGIYVYVGKRLYDIEMAKIELHRLYESGLLEKMTFLEADSILHREHEKELIYLKEKGDM